MCLLICFFTSCKNEDFLDRYPLDQVTDATFFSNSNDLKIYLNQFYNRNNFPLSIYTVGDLDADTHISDVSVNERLEGSLTINSGPALSYVNIRALNYFFDNYNKFEGDFESIKQYVGEAHFFRAFYYFELLKDFGAVQWITKVLKTDSPELYGNRDSRNIIADKIIADLDSAALYLTEEKTNGCSRINKWIALLYQSRVALYEGTWEKYHANDNFAAKESNPNKYLNKTIEAAIKIMNSGLYDIYSTGNFSEDYVNLFGLRDYSDNSEVMFWTKLSLDLGIFTRQLHYLSQPNGYGLTKSLTDSYLCIDGLPISKSPLFKGYNTLTDEVANRDPRFFQTIFTPEAPWKIINGDTIFWGDSDGLYHKLFSNNSLTSVTGYMRRKHYNPNVIFHSQSYEETPSIQYRYAEVLLNFIEAKAELGTITQGDIDKSIKKLRSRVGMPNLFLNNIPNDPNWEFPNLPPIINEIRRERKIELTLERLRFDDLARWAAMDELIVGQRPKGCKASQFTITPKLAVDENGFIDVFQERLPNGWRFNVDRDYLYPIKEAELVLNPNLGQNPGW